MQKFINCIVVTCARQLCEGSTAYVLLRKSNTGEFPEKMANNIQDKKEIEFLNFLTKYDLGHYYERLKSEGVWKISHLQHVVAEDLDKIGMSRPERQRLLGKYEQHFSKLGKIKVWFDLLFLCSPYDYLCILRAAPPLT